MTAQGRRIRVSHVPQKPACAVLPAARRGFSGTGQDGPIDELRPSFLPCTKGAQRIMSCEPTPPPWRPPLPRRRQGETDLRDFTAEPPASAGRHRPSPDPAADRRRGGTGPARRRLRPIGVRDRPGRTSRGSARLRGRLVTRAVPGPGGGADKLVPAGRTRRGLPAPRRWLQGRRCEEAHNRQARLRGSRHGRADRNPRGWSGCGLSTGVRRNVRRPDDHVGHGRLR